MARCGQHAHSNSFKLAWPDAVSMHTVNATLMHWAELPHNYNLTHEDSCSGCEDAAVAHAVSYSHQLINVLYSLSTNTKLRIVRILYNVERIEVMTLKDRIS